MMRRDKRITGSEDIQRVSWKMVNSLVIMGYPDNEDTPLVWRKKHAFYTINT
jgi:metal-dependent amidase/aminoacylase/carboxypeptidase family protein